MSHEGTKEKTICHIPVMGYGTMDFKLSAEAVQALIDAGQGAKAQCLDDRETIKN